MSNALNLVDSHCHLNCLKGGDTVAGVEHYLQNARAQGVTHFLCVSIDMETFPEVLSLAEQFADVSASVGVHPNHVEGREADVDELVSIARSPNIIAIGETGLDYFRSEGDVEWQRERFRTHIRAAKKSGKPIIIHTRDAKQDTLEIMREENAHEVGGVMHCFTEDWEMAREAMDLNFYISFSGIVTFKSATELQDVARKVPADRMLVETDSPYLAPVPYRGKQNEPAYVRNVAEFIATLRNESVEQIAQNTTQNFQNLFRVSI